MNPFFAKLAMAAEPHAGVNPVGAAAHGCNESNFGESRLAQKANNVWGVKATGKPTKFWTGESVEMSTWEEVGGVAVPTVAKFRAYPSLYAAVGDYADIIARVYPFAAKYAAHPGLFLAGLFIMGPAKWATDSKAFAKAVRILDQEASLDQKVGSDRRPVVIGEFTTLVNNSPSVGGGIGEITAAITGRAHVRGPHKASRTLRDDGSWKLDIQEIPGLSSELMVGSS